MPQIHSRALSPTFGTQSEILIHRYNSLNTSALIVARRGGIPTATDSPGERE